MANNQPLIRFKPQSLKIDWAKAKSNEILACESAIVDTVRFLTNDDSRDDWHRTAVCPDRSYDVEKDLISSFPLRVRGEQIQPHENRCIHSSLPFHVRGLFLNQAESNSCAAKSAHVCLGCFQSRISNRKFASAATCSNVAGR